MFGLIMAGIFTSVGTTCKVVVKKWRESSSVSDALRRIGGALFGLVPFLWMVALTYVWCSWSEEALSASSRVYTILFLSSLFTEITTHVMVSHMTGSAINVMDRTSILTLPPLLLANLFYDKIDLVLKRGFLAPAFSLAPERAQLRALLTPGIEESTLIPAMAVFSVVFTSLRVGITIIEVANALDISVFTVPKKKKI